MQALRYCGKATLSSCFELMLRSSSKLSSSRFKRPEQTNLVPAFQVEGYHEDGTCCEELCWLEFSKTGIVGGNWPLAQNEGRL